MRWKYSNLAYSIAGMVVEKVSGQSWADYVDRNIFKPLGMNSSSVDKNVPGLAVPYARRMPDGTWEPEPHMLNDGLAGAVNRGENVRLAATAYIAWSVFHSLPPTARSDADKQQFTTTVDYLLTHRPEGIADPYVLASVALFFQGRGLQPSLMALMLVLLSMSCTNFMAMTRTAAPQPARD